MKLSLRCVALFVVLFCVVPAALAQQVDPSLAQQPSAEPELQLLDHLAGNWVMQGTIAGKQTTHDLQADWVLNREYLRLHEVSREKNANGDPAYEAIIFISWDPKTRGYTCMWLDNTEGGGLTGEGLAHGMKVGNSIPLFFKPPTAQIRTTFAYQPSADTWELTIDDETNGKSVRFASLKLTRMQ